MARSDLLLTKPGGLVCSEALAVGLPLLLTCPIPLQETLNALRLEEAGAALFREKPEALAESLAVLLEDPGQLAAMGVRAGRLGRPDAADRIARLVEEASIRGPVSRRFPSGAQARIAEAARVG
jgi:processive 1,2-diacylglycerol beta-glucosyltransferase